VAAPALAGFSLIGHGLGENVQIVAQKGT